MQGQKLSLHIFKGVLHFATRPCCLFQLIFEYGVDIVADMGAEIVEAEAAVGTAEGQGGGSDVLAAGYGFAAHIAQNLTGVKLVAGEQNEIIEIENSNAAKRMRAIVDDLKSAANMRFSISIVILS